MQGIKLGAIGIDSTAWDALKETGKKSRPEMRKKALLTAQISGHEKRRLRIELRGRTGLESGEYVFSLLGHPLFVNL